MNQRSSVVARGFAVAALICGVVVLVVVVSGSLGGDDDRSRNGVGGGQAAQKSERDGPVPKAYVVQSGDTLISIARKTGVSVAEIQILNPGIDPQILISGEKLKLR